MWISCFVCFCKRLKWPKGSEKGSPTELGQHIIPNFYLSVIRLVTTQMNWTKINSYGKNEVCSLLLQLLPHNCQILLLEFSSWSCTEKWDTNFLFLLKSSNNYAFRWPSLPHTCISKTIFSLSNLQLKIHSHNLFYLSIGKTMYKETGGRSKVTLIFINAI